MALDVGDWHHIIDNGRIRFSGDSRTILGNDEIMTQYLGVSRRSGSETAPGTT
jgi:ABC-type branched-subunit amino acid transport system ATPase component